MMVAHHLLSFVAIGCGLATKRCAFFACLALCAEASTPFLNNITAAKLFGGQKGADSLLHFLSGIFLWIAYVPFRMVNFPGVVVGVVHRSQRRPGRACKNARGSSSSSTRP